MLTLMLLCASGFSAFSETHKVTLRAPGGVKVTVYQGFGDTIPAGRPVLVKMTLFGGFKDHTLYLEPGKYHFVASGEGYYTLHKDFSVSGPKRINANPGKMGGKGYEPKRVYEFTDETVKSLSLGAVAKKFPKVMTVPSLSRKKPAQEHTTQEEMEAFITDRDDNNDNMYRYIVGHTTLGLPMPFVIFTTEAISGMDLDAAAEVVRGSGKPTVYLHAHIHGNEPMVFFIDTAYTDKSDNDPTGIIATCKIGNDIYVAHGEKVLMRFPDLLRFLPTYVKEHGYTQASSVRIEPKANGLSVIDQLRATTGLNVVATPSPHDSKETRLNAASPTIESGRVVLVDGAWTEQFIDEVCGFPSKPHDEYVDVLCYAIDYHSKDLRPNGKLGGFFY